MTPQLLWQYGSVILLSLLIRELLIIYKGRMKEIRDNTENNKNCLSAITENLKESSQIQAEILDRLYQEDKIRTTDEVKRTMAWDKLIDVLQKMCSLMNGNNPAIIKLQEEMKKIQKNT